jgi:hypothetical protein
MLNKSLQYIAILCFCSIGSLNAQERDLLPNPQGYITIGIGGGYFGPTFYSGISYVANNNIIVLRYIKGDEFQFNVEGNIYKPSLKIKEYGILYGRTFHKDILELSLSAGVGYVDGIDRGRLIQYKDYEESKISTIGIPFEARFRFDFSFIGLGGAWYGNINKEKNLSAAVFQLSVKLFGY